MGWRAELVWPIVIGGTRRATWPTHADLMLLLLLLLLRCAMPALLLLLLLLRMDRLTLRSERVARHELNLAGLSKTIQGAEFAPLAYVLLLLLLMTHLWLMLHADLVNVDLLLLSGLLITAFCLYCGIRGAMVLRTIAAQPEHRQDSRLRLMAATLVAFQVELLMRGIGYFSSTAVLFAAAILYFGQSLVRTRAAAAAA